jgi:hypothetical protein
MLTTVLLDSNAAGLLKDPRTGLTTRAAIYSAYVRLRLGDRAVADSFKRLHRLALSMLDSGQWHCTVAQAVARMRVVPHSTLAASNAALTTIVDEERAESLAVLEVAPTRVEDLHDDASNFSWWHKSIGEFFCGEAFATDAGVLWPPSTAASPSMRRMWSPSRRT